MPSSGVQTCARSEEHTSELQSHDNLVCRLLLEKKKGLGERLVRRACGGACERRGGPAAARGEHPRVPPLPFARALTSRRTSVLFFFFNEPAPPEISPLPLHDPLPISVPCARTQRQPHPPQRQLLLMLLLLPLLLDRKSTRLNSSHTIISYAVFCL